MFKLQTEASLIVTQALQNSAKTLCADIMKNRDKLIIGLAH